MRILVVLFVVLVFPQWVLAEKLEKATFAGGCFWCMEPPFEKLDGVKSVVSGFTGGEKKNPSYKEVAGGKTKHIESVEVTFDSKKVGYKDLLEVFWRQINPTDSGGQFVDRGHQYSTAIFFHNDEQKQLAEESKTSLQKSKRFKKPIVTPIRKAKVFYKAEDYHQDYYKVNPIRYKYYRYNSGRDQFLEKVWGKDQVYKIKPMASAPSGCKKPTEKEIKAKLSKDQYYVTQQDGTEKPFKNKYWNHKAEGIYVDVVTGEPLFSSLHKFKSGTGWPSFYQPLVDSNIVEKEDKNLILGTRTEVRSKCADSHLGHVFKDGPKPTGLRYCINSAALEFVPVDQLEKKGYGQFKELFIKPNEVAKKKN